jgi:hypothetical protein
MGLCAYLYLSRDVGLGVGKMLVCVHERMCLYVYAGAYVPPRASDRHACAPPSTVPPLSGPLWLAPPGRGLPVQPVSMGTKSMHEGTADSRGNHVGAVRVSSCSLSQDADHK